MVLVNKQVEVEAYVSDKGNLCLVFDASELVEIESKDVLIIRHENAERFILGLSVLLEEIKNG